MFYLYFHSNKPQSPPPQKKRNTTEISKNIFFVCVVRETTSYNEMLEYQYVQYYPCPGSTVKSARYFL
jgi:hypothetical protein